MIDKEFIIKILEGTLSLIIGITMLFFTIKESKERDPDYYGARIKLYLASLGFIGLGLDLIYRSLF